MKNLALLFVIATAMLASQARAASEAYVTDRLEVTMRSGTSTQHEILKLLPTGTRLSVLEVDESSGYTRVRTPSGTEGWVLSRYVTETPPARLRLQKAERQLAQLRRDNQRLSQQLETVQAENQALTSKRDSLQQKVDELGTELAEIRRTSADALDIAETNRTLNRRVAELETELQVLHQQNASLKDRTRRDWFVIGAIVVIGSMLFGILLTRVRWRRRSGWGDL